MLPKILVLFALSKAIHAIPTGFDDSLDVPHAYGSYDDLMFHFDPEEPEMPTMDTDADLFDNLVINTHPPKINTNSVVNALKQTQDPKAGTFVTLSTSPLARQDSSQSPGRARIPARWPASNSDVTNQPEAERDTRETTPSSSNTNAREYGPIKVVQTPPSRKRIHELPIPEDKEVEMIELTADDFPTGLFQLTPGRFRISPKKGTQPKQNSALTASLRQPAPESSEQSAQGQGDKSIGSDLQRAMKNLRVKTKQSSTSQGHTEGDHHEELNELMHDPEFLDSINEIEEYSGSGFMDRRPSNSGNSGLSHVFSEDDEDDDDAWFKMDLEREVTPDSEPKPAPTPAPKPKSKQTRKPRIRKPVPATDAVETAAPTKKLTPVPDDLEFDMEQGKEWLAEIPLELKNRKEAREMKLTPKDVSEQSNLDWVWRGDMPLSKKIFVITALYEIAKNGPHASKINRPFWSKWEERLELPPGTLKKWIIEFRELQSGTGSFSKTSNDDSNVDSESISKKRRTTPV